MTERENLLRMLSGEGPDHLPLDVWLTEPAYDMIEAQTGSRDEISALGISVGRVGPRYAANAGAWRLAYRELGFEPRADALIGATGVLHDLPPPDSLGAAYHLLEMRHPLALVESVEQLERLPWPDVESDAAFEHIPGELESLRNRGVATIGQMDCTMFEMAWYLRGMDRLFLDLVDGNGIADWLLDWFTRRAEVAVRRFAAASVDIVWLGDDVGTQRGLMMAVPFWREHLKGRLARVVNAARDVRDRQVWIAYHSDGDVGPILDDLIEIGIDVLNPVQPECMDVRGTIEAYRNRIAFWGMVGTQTTMPFGSPEAVASVVAELRELADSGARIVVSPTHAIEPDVPWPNLERLIREVKRPLHTSLEDSLELA